MLWPQAVLQHIFQYFFGWQPSRSYIAKKKNGIINPIIKNTDAVFPIALCVRKYTGRPTTAARLKQTNCLLVKLKATFVLTRVKSLGTGTYGKKITFFLFPHRKFPA